MVFRAWLRLVVAVWVLSDLFVPAAEAGLVAVAVPPVGAAALAVPAGDDPWGGGELARERFLSDIIVI